MKTVQDAFNSFKIELNNLYDGHEAGAITALVLSEITGLSKAGLRAFPDSKISENDAVKLNEILTELKTGKPLQYILGYTEFYGLKFNVNPAVLIPRPETEELVSWILQSGLKPQTRILDIGTGSGCIAVSLKHHLKTVKVSAIDVSPAALQTAKLNATINQCDIDFIEADILTPDTLMFDNKFDIIVSNPPYVTQTDKLQMHSNVTNFEPHIALFVPETDPLLYYNAIADFAVKNLTNSGLLFFEINEAYAEDVTTLLIKKGFTDIQLRKDIRDKDRMIKAVLRLH